jgi:hypothetical protein
MRNRALGNLEIPGSRFARPGMTPGENFSSEIKLFLPVQPFPEKFSGSRLTQIKSISRSVPPHMRGVSRSSRTLGAGCDGRGGVKRRMALRADGEVVWS